MKLRMLLASVAISIPLLAQQPDFLRPGPVIPAEQLRHLQTNKAPAQPKARDTTRPPDKCSIPLTVLEADLAPASKMPQIKPDEKIAYSMKYLAPPAPPCKLLGKPDRSTERK